MIFKLETLQKKLDALEWQQKRRQLSYRKLKEKATPLIQELTFLANAGVADAALMLARVYQNGDLVPTDKHKSYQFYSVYLKNKDKLAAEIRHNTLPFRPVHQRHKDAEKLFISTATIYATSNIFNSFRLAYGRFANMMQTPLLLQFGNKIAFMAWAFYSYQLLFDQVVIAKTLINERDKVREQGLWTRYKMLMKKDGRMYRDINAAVWASSALLIIAFGVIRPENLLIGYTFDVVNAAVIAIKRYSEIKKEQRYIDARYQSLQQKIVKLENKLAAPDALSNSERERLEKQCEEYKNARTLLAERIPKLESEKNLQKKAIKVAMAYTITLLIGIAIALVVPPVGYGIMFVATVAHMSHRFGLLKKVKAITKSAVKKVRPDLPDKIGTFVDRQSDALDRYTSSSAKKVAHAVSRTKSLVENSGIYSTGKNPRNKSISMRQLSKPNLS